MNRISGQIDKSRGAFGGLVEMGVVPGAKITMEGVALKHDGIDAAGNPMVTVASAPEDKIIGVAYLENPTSFCFPVIGETGYVKGGKYNTGHFPLLIDAADATKSVSVKKVNADKTLSDVTVSEVNANGEITVSGVEDNDIIRVTYTFVPSLAEALANFGESFNRHTFDEMTGIVAIPKGHCQIFTLTYDAQQTYELGATLVADTVAGVPGVLVPGTTPEGGMEIRVSKVPTAQDKFLGISFVALY